MRFLSRNSEPRVDDVLKVLIILLVGLVLEAIGVVLLSHGLHEIGEVKQSSLAAIGRLVAHGMTNRHILLGVLFLVLFFGILLYLLSQQDVSLIWPLTSLGFVITVLAARFVRHEEITALRWGGVILIVVGAALVAWSEQQKPDNEDPDHRGPDKRVIDRSMRSDRAK
jgi:drug/metabolite transporter (DMT)-like permease